MDANPSGRRDDRRRQLFRGCRIGHGAHEGVEPRRSIAAKRELLEAAKERAATLPHRERQLGLVHRLGELLLDAHEQWLDEVEQELTDP